MLKNKTDSTGRLRRGRVSNQFSTGWHQQTGQHLQQSGFAATGRTDDGQEFSLNNIQTEVLENRSFRTFKTKLEIAQGRVQNANFDGYHVLRIDDAPTVIETHVIESGERMGGIGEPPVPPITPALVNAVSALVGRRIRKLPLMDALA